MTPAVVACWAVVACCAVGLLACGSDKPQPETALRPLPPAAEAAAAPTTADLPNGIDPPPLSLKLAPLQGELPRHRSAALDAPTRPNAAAGVLAPALTPTAEPPKPVLPVAEPAATPPPASKVVVPHSEYLRAEIPSGLQAALDDDPRMQPWLNQAMATVDKCYAAERQRDAAAEGVIVIELAMHLNARPDAEIKSLPAALRGLVGCVTAGLMGVRMPLFTTHEGERFTARLHFTAAGKRPGPP